jgi:hypothetical protein
MHAFLVRTQGGIGAPEWGVGERECLGPIEVQGMHFIPLHCVCQTVYGLGVLLNEAFNLTPKNALVYVGAWKDLVENSLTGWSWSDGTPSTNLNCGIVGCT